MDPASLKDRASPEGLPPLLEALWWDARGDWDRAHQVAQGVEGAAGAWVHAYLHRKEGDLSNADYWYRRAGRARPVLSLEAEWEDLARAF